MKFKVLDSKLENNIFKKNCAILQCTDPNRKITLKKQLYNLVTKSKPY